jgi:hypothetical protein
VLGGAALSGAPLRGLRDGHVAQVVVEVVAHCVSMKRSTCVMK